MKTVMQLLSLLLCFEFIVAPVQGSLFINSAMAEDEVKTCPAGQQFEASVNRCLTKIEVLKVNEATQNCGTDKNCYADNAKSALSDSGQGYSDKAKTSGLDKAGTIAAIAIPLVIVTNVLIEKGASKSGSAFKCKPASLTLMYGAAAALAVGEIYGYYNHKSRLKKIKEEWDLTVVPKDESGADKKRTEATEAQSQAFEFLAQNEEQVGKTAKTKKGFYLAATGLFAAGAAMAALEMFQLSSAKALLLKARASTDPSAPAEALKHENTINRLTCSTDKELFKVKEDGTKEGTASGKSKEDLADADKAKKATDEKTATDNLAAQEKSKQAKVDQQKADELTQQDNKDAEDAFLKKYPDSAKAKEINAQRDQQILDDYNESQRIKLESAPVVPNKAPLPTAPVQIKPIKSFWSPKENLDKMKRVAAYNLSTAKDADQFVNLMREFESIEFENYSKVRYEENNDGLKDVTFSPIVAKIMAEFLMPQAEAGILDGMISSAGTSMMGPLLGGITKIFGLNGAKLLSAKELNEITSKSKSFITRAIGKPVTRLAINGVLGTWMGIAEQNLNKQQHLAQERAKKLRSMKEDFVTANGLMYCTEADRSDSTKPKCYCYTPENKVNPARSSSEICKNALTTMNKNTIDDSDEKVCVTTNMAMDTSCACRSTNTCLKTTSGFTTMGFSPATFKMISANAAPANDLFSGVTSAGNIADSAGINAARTQAAAANSIAGDAAAVKEAKNAADEFSKGLLATTSGLSMGSGSGSSPLPTTPAGAAAALDKEIKDSKEDIDVTTSGKSNSSSADLNSTEEAPEFGMTPTDAASQEIEIAEVMGKEVDFGSNDINKAKDTNLFEVLSNRYQRSGRKRLLEEGSTAPADAPAKSDISN